MLVQNSNKNLQVGTNNEDW